MSLCLRIVSAVQVAEKADEAGEKVDKWGRQSKEEAYRAGDRAEDAMYNTDAKVWGIGFARKLVPVNFSRTDIRHLCFSLRVE